MNWFHRLNRRFLLRYRLEYAIVLAVVYGLRAMSPRFAWASARDVGRLVYRVGVRRKTLDRNLALACPEKSPEGRRQIAIKSMAHFASMVVDVIFQRRMVRPGNFRKRFKLGGWAKEYFDHYGAEGFRRRARSCLFASAHMGNWEMGPGFFNLFGVPLIPVYRRTSNPFLDRLLRRIRLQQQTKVIEKRGAVEAMFRCFEAGENVGILFDQEAARGIRVPFFGHEATIQKTPAVLVRDYGVKVVMGFLVRHGDFLNYETVGKLIQYDRKTKDRDADIRFITADLMKHLEELIRQYPHQYLWSHRRWEKQAGGGTLTP